ILSLVPILMLGFSALGVVLTVLRPELLVQLEETLRSVLPKDSVLADNLYSVINSALTNWASLTVVALGVIIWVASGWVGNLKRAVRLLMRNQVDEPGATLPLPLDVLANFAGLIGLLVGIAATFATSAVATSLGGAVGEWLGIGTSPGWSLLLRGLGLAVSLVAGTLLFRLLFAWFSPGPVPTHLAWVGSTLGSVALLVLQLLTGYLIAAFSRNLGSAVFGSTIVLMLFLNLFATLILFIATWLATAEVPVPELEPVPGPEPEPEAVETRPGQLYVSSTVAEKSLGVGLKTGYVVGAATGLGLGAVLFGWLRTLFGRRRR
ncbi:MAG: YhjD/YihY/BrkB family envelope integrity protein, partial [Propionicimonas sp.]|nr:YhjD/YihY/BrkB family envelope integrity protein [Propionicimonas sp.]